MKYLETPINAGWVNKRIPESKLDREFWDIYTFFVLYTICEGPSYKGVPIRQYGWGSKVWKTTELKNALYNVADLRREGTLCFAKNKEEMRNACKKTLLSDGFHKNRDVEKIAAYKGKDNEIICICRHIRNSFAHGRFMVYENHDGDDVFIFEDGVKNNGKLQIRARMVLKKATLLRWIQIIKRVDKR